MRTAQLLNSRAARPRELYAALVGRRTGIVREVALVETIDGDARLFHAAASIRNPHPSWSKDSSMSAGGAGPTREAALTAALCEGLERFAAGECNHGQNPLRSRAEIGFDSLAPAAFAQFSREQRQHEGFPYTAVSDETPLGWVSGRRLDKDSPWAVPAFTVHLPYEPELEETLVGPGITTGLCCADSLESAIVGGTCEVFERDALALTWLKGLTPPRIDGDWLVEQAGELLPPADDAWAFDLTSDIGVPVVLVVCRGEGPHGPILSVGSACRLDGRAALRKAALECAQDRVYVRQLLDLDPDWQPQPDFSNVTDFSLHARLYSVRSDLFEPAFAFLLREAASSDLPTPGVDSGDGQSPLRRIVQKLQDGGHRGAWVDLTPSCALSLGLHVVRVVIPSLLPLHGHHRLAYLGHSRLRYAHAALPRSSLDHQHSIWPYPHPFP